MVSYLRPTACKHRAAKAANRGIGWRQPPAPHHAHDQRWWGDLDDQEPL